MYRSQLFPQKKTIQLTIFQRLYYHFNGTVVGKYTNSESTDIYGIGYGLPALVIMKDLMGLENELPKEIEKELLPCIYSAISNGEIYEAEELYGKLLNLSPELPYLVRIRKLIELKRRKQTR